MNRRARIVAAAAIVLAVAGIAGWRLFGGDEPERVSLSTAVDSVTTATGGDGAASPATDAGIDGEWTVDTDSGSFDFESATGTFAGFRVDEELSTVGSTTAVGRTGQVSGSMTIDGDRVTAATFDVDLTTITTNERRRDDKVQRALETSRFPNATFVLREPIELGHGAAGGRKVTTTAEGDLTLHGVTRQVALPLEAQVVNGTVVVVGSTDITFSDYDVEVPRAPIVLRVSDKGTIELQLLLVRK